MGMQLWNIATIFEKKNLLTKSLKHILKVYFLKIVVRSPHDHVILDLVTAEHKTIEYHKLAFLKYD